MKAGNCRSRLQQQYSITPPPRSPVSPVCGMGMRTDNNALLECVSFDVYTPFPEMRMLDTGRQVLMGTRIVRT